MRGSFRPWRMAMVFLGVVFGLQWGWSELRGSALERWVIHDLTVGTAVRALNWVNPGLGAWGEGPRIRAPGGGLNILNGCEGTEVLFLLVAALLVSSLPWRWRLCAMLVGSGWVFAWNQLRLWVLFHAHRTDKAWFDLLHGLVAPAVLIAMSLLFVVLVLQAHARVSKEPA